MYDDAELMGDPCVLPSSIAERIPALWGSGIASLLAAKSSAAERWKSAMYAEAGGVIGSVALVGGLCIVAARMSARCAMSGFELRPPLIVVDVVRIGAPGGNAGVLNPADPTGVNAYGVSGKVCLTAEAVDGEFGSYCKNP